MRKIVLPAAKVGYLSEHCRFFLFMPYLPGEDSRFSPRMIRQSDPFLPIEEYKAFYFRDLSKFRDKKATFGNLPELSWGQKGNFRQETGCSCGG
ncbi:hypothetical protein [Sabulibacter ruber]|uniref:hypothetical protein n=1 Tax=Sabulibacter ruber TaxID=2811901 RepID=UPI001A97C3CE|nr:hypothetical protein [Sabulibacter ruber]